MSGRAKINQLLVDSSGEVCVCGFVCVWVSVCVSVFQRVCVVGCLCFPNDCVFGRVVSVCVLSRVSSLLRIQSEP